MGTNRGTWMGIALVVVAAWLGQGVKIAFAESVGSSFP